MVATSALTSDRAHVAMQERELVFPAFDAATAWSLGNTLRGLAVDRKHSIVIDIRRFGDPNQQLFYTAMPGTIPDNARWVERKAKIVARFHRSSYAAGLYLQEQGLTFAEKYSLPEADYAAHGGAFPITVAGTGVVGAVTVSGLPQRSDHELVVEGICIALNSDYASYKLPCSQKGVQPMLAEAAVSANITQAVPFFGISSMDKSLRFYVDGLGFRMTKQWIPEGTPGGNIRWCWLELDDIALMLQEHRGKEAASWESLGKVGVGVSICFQCVDALAFHRDVKARGIVTQRPFVGNSMWVVNISDPDGYSLSFQSPTDAPEESELSERV